MPLPFRLPWTLKRKFDVGTLRRNDITSVILDERWNKLFANTQKTGHRAQRTEAQELLKEEARLLADQKRSRPPRSII